MPWVTVIDPVPGKACLPSPFAPSPRQAVGVGTGCGQGRAGLWGCGSPWGLHGSLPWALGDLPLPGPQAHPRTGVLWPCSVGGDVEGGQGRGAGLVFTLTATLGCLVLSDSHGKWPQRLRI